MSPNHHRNFFWRAEGEIVLASFIVSIVGISFFIYGSVYENPPIQDRNRGVVNPIVERGSELIIKNAYIETKSCSSNFVREMWHLGDKSKGEEDIRFWSEGEYRPGFPSNVDEAKLTKHKFTTRNLRIPWSAPIGKAQYNVTVEWFCNPIQRLWPHVEALPALDFEVVEKGTLKRGPSGTQP